jgi:Sigma-54 interaction domain
MKNAHARWSSPNEDWRDALSVHADLQRMGMPRANLLLVGVDDRLQRLLELLSRDYREPVEIWTPDEPLVLPPVDRVKTFILRNVEQLSHVDQGRLFNWLDEAAGRTQVVSTAAEPLLPRVYAGVFMSALYYRLNVLYVEVPETLIPRPRSLAS